MTEPSVTLNIKTFECQCSIDLPDPQSCLALWSACPPLETQTDSMARKNNSLYRPNQIGGFPLFIAQHTNSKYSTIYKGKKAKHQNRKFGLNQDKNHTLQQTFSTVTFPKHLYTGNKTIPSAATAMHCHQLLSCRLYGHGWLAFRRLSQHYALHMKQDISLYPLGEFTSSEPPPPPLPHLPLKTSSPFCWRPDILRSGYGISRVGVVIEVKEEVLAPVHYRIAGHCSIGVL